MNAHDDSTTRAAGDEWSIDVAAEYRLKWGPERVLDVFRDKNDFWYLFDSTPLGKSDPIEPANRVLAAWGYTKPDDRVGLRSRLRHYPLPPGSEQTRDRGHLIALASGGGEDVNIVPQASRLNRGHSEAGKRWRALERHCAATPGVFIFVGLEYDDTTDVPTRLDVRIVEPDGTHWNETFVNDDDSPDSVS